MANVRPFSPSKGDVLFFLDASSDAVGSAVAQWLIDPSTTTRGSFFDHVAIAVSGKLALEAVPAPRIGDEMLKQFELPNTAEIAEWSRVELRAGVRLVPIADLLIANERSGIHRSILRRQSVSDKDLTDLDLLSPKVLHVIGSQYSVASLQRVAAERFGKALTDFAVRSQALASIPTDIATRLGLDPAFRTKLQAEMLDYVPPAAAKTFFCSQLAVFCLELVSLIPDGMAAETSTPTGLHRQLVQRGWNDVTKSCYSKDAVIALSGTSSGEIAAHYTSMLALVVMASRSAELRVTTDVIAGTLQNASSMLARFEEHLDRLHTSPKARSVPMSPFDEGIAAATTGMRKDDNPHEPGTAAHSDWNAGFRSAIDADEATDLDNDPNHKGPYSEE